MGAVIAVEGPDLSGKTTFIKALREVPAASRWPVFRMDVPKTLLETPTDPQIERIAEAFSAGLLAMKRTLSFILDRCYVSSYVYSLVFGRQVNLGYIDKVAYEMNPLIVYMRTPIDLILQRYERRGDRLADRTRLISIHSAYERWLEKNPFHDRIIVLNSEAAAFPYGSAVQVVDMALKSVTRITPLFSGVTQ